MKINLLGLLAVATLASGCNFMQGIQGSGVTKTEARSVGSFTAVRLEGSSDVDIKMGTPATVEVTADDNLLQYIETKVEGDTLVISTKERISSKLGPRISIIMPKLNGISISGSGDVNANGAAGDPFEASISGSGDIKVAGIAKSVKARIAGSGDIDLTGVDAEEADASISGSGDIALKVEKRLNASIAGSGDISYIGSPQVEKSIAGSGSVRSRN